MLSLTQRMCNSVRKDSLLVKTVQFSWKKVSCSSDAQLQPKKMGWSLEHMKLVIIICWINRCQVTQMMRKVRKQPKISPYYADNAKWTNCVEYMKLRMLYKIHVHYVNNVEKSHEKVQSHTIWTFYSGLATWSKISEKIHKKTERLKKFY